MRVQCIPLGPLETNCYIVDNGQEAIVIDPAYEPGPILTYLKRNNLRLDRICNTHMHFDHVHGNAALAEATGVAIYANKGDDYLCHSEMAKYGGYGIPPVPPYAYVQQEPTECTLFGSPCRILHTPGHTPGSLSYYWAKDNIVFTGDVLFYLSAGRTDLPGGDGEALRHSIQQVLFSLPEETIVYPGHGPSTRIGEERSNNPYYRLHR